MRICTTKDKVLTVIETVTAAPMQRPKRELLLEKFEERFPGGELTFPEKIGAYHCIDSIGTCAIYAHKSGEKFKIRFYHNMWEVTDTTEDVLPRLKTSIDEFPCFVHENTSGYYD